MTSLYVLEMTSYMINNNIFRHHSPVLVLVLVLCPNEKCEANLTPAIHRIRQRDISMASKYPDNRVTEIRRNKSLSMKRICATKNPFVKDGQSASTDTVPGMASSDKIQMIMILMTAATDREHPLYG
jgi:hypothetical protein